MSYDPVRALTSGELAYLRSDGQYTKLRAIIVPQQTVLACKCSATIVNNDGVTTVPINTITSGSTANVKSGMTAYVGSAAGLDDYGMLRVKSASGSSLEIARHSGITWTPSVFITVVDEFGLWAKLPVLDLSAETVSIAMDDNIYYTNQNTLMSPTPVFGCDTAVPFTSGSLTYDATNSYCLDGSTIDTYAWAVYNGGLLSGSMVVVSAGVANFVFPAAGSYTIELTITASNAKVTTGRRTCYVWGETGVYAPLDQIQVTGMTGSRDEGGWNCKVTAYAGAGSAVRDRAKVIIIAEDRYPSKISIGQMAGSEHVVMIGAIGGESIKYNREFSTVEFTVQGVQYWLKQITGPSTFLESVAGVPAYWTEITDMTIDKVIHHFMYWRSTAIEVMDVYKSGNMRIIGGMSASIGAIWEQIYDTCLTRMMVYIATDRYGRFFAWEDPQVLPLASRTGIPVVQAITTNDLMEDVDLQRSIVDPVSLLEVAGLAQQAGGSAVEMYMSRAPGSLFYNRYGANDQNDRLVVSNQVDANMLSGMLLAKKNNVYGSVNFSLAQNNRMIDIAPAQYVKHTTTVAQNVRGVNYTDKQFLPLSVSYNVDEKGVVVVGLEAEGETDGIPGYTVIMPQEPITNYPDVPNLPTIDWVFPPFPWIAPAAFVPPLSPDCWSGSAASGPFSLLTNRLVESTSLEGILIPYSGYIRSDTNPNRSRYTLVGSFQELNTAGLPSYYMPRGSGGSFVYNEVAGENWYDVEALDSDLNVVAYGESDGVGTGVFQVQDIDGYDVSGSGTNFAYIRIQTTLSPSIRGSTVDVIYERYGGWTGCATDSGTVYCGSTYTGFKDRTAKGWNFNGGGNIHHDILDPHVRGVFADGVQLITTTGGGEGWVHVYGSWNMPVLAGKESCTRVFYYIATIHSPVTIATGAAAFDVDYYVKLGGGSGYAYPAFGCYTYKDAGINDNNLYPEPLDAAYTIDITMDIVPTYKIHIADFSVKNICQAVSGSGVG